MSAIVVLRLITFITCIVCSLTVLGVAAHMAWFEDDIINLANNYYGFSVFTVDPFIPLALTVSVLTILVILILGSVRTGPFRPTIVIEFSILSALWILWLATASLTVKNSINNCAYFFEGPILVFCYEINVVSGFSFLAWIALISYAIALLVLTLIASSRGHSVWTVPIDNANFFAPNVALPSSGGITPKNENQSHAYYPPNLSPPPQSYMTPQPMYTPSLSYASEPHYPSHQAVLLSQQSPPPLPNNVA